MAEKWATNRTNLELKHVRRRKESKYQASTNRTNLELKHTIIQTSTRLIRPTNRTNLELKLVGGKAQVSEPALPIAPIWNWNSAKYQVAAKGKFYQSHQSGIETMYPQWWLVFGNSTNRTNLELKLDRIIPVTICRSLPIAPIWNWNEIVHCIPPRWNCATNRTNLELKRKN